MATVRKTITLTEQQDAWIAAQIEAGSYTNDSEAIRDLIRREQERQHETPADIEAIRAALIEGEKSAQKYGWVTKSPSQMLHDFKQLEKQSAA